MYFVILGMRAWWILRCDAKLLLFWLLSDYATSTVDSSVATIWQTRLIKYAALPSSLTQAITTWLKVGNKITVTHMLLKKKNKRLHKRTTMVASASICIFICFSHLLRAAPKHLISQSLKSHPSRSCSAHLPSVHVTNFRGRPFYSVEATTKIHKTWQWLMTRCQLTALTKDRALSLCSLYCHALTK